MIATTRGLAILAGIAVALLSVLLVVGPREHAAVDRSLVPGFDPAKVNELVLSRGDWTARVVRTNDGWLIENAGAKAEPATIDAIFTALRGGRWHRRADIAAAGPARARIEVAGTTLSVHADLPGTGQTWLVRDHEALLVDSWVATALAPEPLALHVRHPLECAGATSIVARTASGTLRIEGGRLVEPRALWLDENALRALADACARIEILGLDGRADGQPGLHITAGATSLTETGRCSDTRQVHVETSSGPGCVDGAALRDLDNVVRAIVRAPHAAIDLRPLPIEPAKLTLADGSVLELAGTPRVAGSDADRDRARELVVALTARGEHVEHRPATKPTGTITAVDRDGTQVTLELWDHLIGRAGEPAVIRIPEQAWRVITRPSAALRDATRWREDATTISSITLDHVTYRRGAALGEWTREPAGSVDPALVDALVEALATVRAPAAAPPRAIAHRLTLTITPPAGAPITHAIELGAPTADGCPGRVDGAPALLPLPLCTAAVALAAQR